MTAPHMTPPGGLRVGIVIPARDEAPALPHVLPHIPTWVAEVIVVDNGSRDGTADIARDFGARVVAEPRRGYGFACLAGIAALAPHVDTVLFMDADASDRPEEMARLLAPIAAGQADLVIGSRTAAAEPGSLTPQQRFGNWLACALIRLIWGVRYSDLGPFRAIRRDALARLAMQDETWGWTVEMQVRAARIGLRTQEVPVGYRRRIGTSKISGTLSGTIRAGTKILWVIGTEALRHLVPRRRERRG
jgi:glycosyltransferase involved in cell wall biosynthesis